jgi:hypothetical protein
MPRGSKRPGSGRKKGVANKITQEVRRAIMEAFSILGGAEYLTKIARTDPKAFCTLRPCRVQGRGEVFSLAPGAVKAAKATPRPGFHGLTGTPLCSWMKLTHSRPM